MASALAQSFTGKVSAKDASMMTFLARIGVVHSDKQIAVREAVLTPEVLAQLDAADAIIAATPGAFIGGEAPNADDTLIAAAVLPIVNVILEPSLRNGKYAKLASWCDVMTSSVESLGEHASHYSNKKRIGRQIDVYADSTEVRALADACVQLNAGFKKAQSQRQKEKASKEGGSASAAVSAAAATPAAPAAVVFALGESVSCELSVDEKIAAMTMKLESLEITHSLVKHDAAVDVDTLNKVLAAESGVKCKNLFLKSKKPKDADDSGLWLVVCPGDATVDLKALQKHLGYPSNKELRFGREGDLSKSLACVRGDVTPFALTNDPEAKVNVVLDAGMMADPANKLWFHPLSNEASMCISAGDLRKYVQASGRVAHEIDLATLTR